MRHCQQFDRANTPCAVLTLDPETKTANVRLEMWDTELAEGLSFDRVPRMEEKEEEEIRDEPFMKKRLR